MCPLARIGRAASVCLAAGAVVWSAGAQTLLRELYSNLPGTSVSDLTSAAKFPHHPDLRVLVNLFEAPVNFADNYGTRMRGYVRPPVSGPYRFWIAGDDHCELYLSSSEAPELKTLIAEVPGWTTSRQWTKFPEQQSAPIALEAGRRYYIEALQKEGGGGDSLAVGWTLPSGSLERPIPGARLQPWIVSTTPPSIVTQPADLAVFEQESPLFRVSATGLEPLSYQWFRNGQLEAAEVASGFQLEPVTLEDSGSTFRCVIANTLGAVTSRVATLTVRAETNAPAVRALHPPAGFTVRSATAVEVWFTEPVQGVDAADLWVNGQPATGLTGFHAGPYVFTFAPPPPGPVLFAWAPGHGIRDFSSVPNALVAAEWAMYVDPTLELGALAITEFMAANESGLEDEDGEVQDWIELQNQGTRPVNLAGWSLSDDPDQPGRWVFPDRTLAPGAYLVVFASAKDRRGPGASRLHTDFKLNPAGEFLGLFTPENPRVLAAGYSPRFPEQRNDVSYGLGRTGPAWFATPTPGAPNAVTELASAVADVEFSVRRGLFTFPFNLTLHTATPAATIRFTTDGSVPTETRGTPYTGPLRLTRTTLVRAAAFRAQSLPSRVGTHSYLFNVPPAQRALPALSIVTDTNHLWGPAGILGIGGGVYSNGVWYPVRTNDYHNPSQRGDAWERLTSAELITATNGSEFQIDCGLRVHGSPHIRPRYTPSSKFSYRLYFRGDYGPTWLEYPWFPLAGVSAFDVVTLRAGKNDITNPFLKDELVRRLGVDMGMVQVSGAFASLFLNGVYKGYYNPCERVENGFLYQHHGGSKAWDVIANGGNGTVQDGDAVAWTALRNLVMGQPQTVPANYRRTSLLLDLDHFVDYLLVNAWCCVRDWPDNNWRAARCREPAGPFRFYLWDAEGAFGGFNAPVSYDIFAAPTNVQNSVLTRGTSPIPRFYQALVQSPEFRLLFADRVHRHLFNGGALTEERVASRFNEMAAELAPVIPGFNRSILTSWIPNRRRYLTEHLALQGLYGSSNAPVLGQHGGRVPPGFPLEMTHRAGTIYYTTDGTDPRVPFTGAVAANAVAYTPGVPLVLTRSTPLRARARAGTEWSALTSADFTLGTLLPPVRFTEIHYHPAGGDAFEFIELRNLGDVPYDLSGHRFAGVEFQVPQPTVLAPGQVYLLANNAHPALFAAAYPSAVVQGWFAGNLNNAGERLALLDPAGRIVTAVDYDDEDGWPKAADGGGPSLQVRDPFGDASAAANWTASPRAGGAPGAVDEPPAPSLSPIRLSEFQALNLTTIAHAGAAPDWIELHNASAAPVDLGGWSLTDDSDPRKFVFPAHTLLGADAYLVVWCDSRLTAPGFHTGFALDAEGETLRLFDPATNSVAAVTFGPQLADRSVGELEGAWTLCLPTPGARNLPAALAPLTHLVLNEWLATPRPGESAWVELHNTHTDLPLALGGVHLASGRSADRLPALTFLGPGAFLVYWCDAQPGRRHLHCRLSDGSRIALHDPLAQLVHSVTNAAQAQGVSSGRLPDGGATIAPFPATATPGAANADLERAPVRFHELMTRNRGAVTSPEGAACDWLELHNPQATHVSLAGCRLGIGDTPVPWTFPPGTTLAPGGYLVLWGDTNRPPSTVAPGPTADLNLARDLPDHHGALRLFGPQGQLFDALEYGFQVPNLSLGRLSTGWTLLARPTPGAANAGPAPLGSPDGVRFNEWMARPTDGPDWIELFNPGALPVQLDGWHVADDPSLAGAGKASLPPRSFLGPADWLVLVADDRGTRASLGFRLDAAGETLCLYSPTPVTLRDLVDFAAQTSGVSQGRYPDGAPTIVHFASYPTPGGANLADTDGDRIPDDYELAHGLDPGRDDAFEDLDGDGASNLAEFLAGTAANDPASAVRLELLAATPASVTLRVHLGAQRHATLLATADPTLAPTAWFPVLEWPATPQVHTRILEDPQSATPTLRFYRLRVAPPPLGTSSAWRFE